MKGKLKLSYMLVPCLAFILAVAVPLIGSADIIEEFVAEWVVRYNGTDNSGDVAHAIAVDIGDISGNVYVTGGIDHEGTNPGYATVKYDADGNELWVRPYNGSVNGWTSAYDIALDSTGNVYVTGVVYVGETGDHDYATIKYAPNGNQRWVKRYDGYLGPGDHDDWARAISIDTSGNVYVTGRSQGSGTGGDYATIKYEADGTELWAKRYNGPANGHDGAHDVAVDALGNVYVTGYSDGGTTHDDYALVKYDTDGKRLSIHRYDGPASGFDSANAIAVDRWGDVYVTGESDGIGTYSDYATVKYANKVEAIMDLPAGWSMISLPVRPTVATAGTLFPGASVMYKFQRATGYMRVTGGENLEVGMGYWILLDSPLSYTITGKEITEYGFPAEDGWYMIGGCTHPAHTIGINTVINVIYDYVPGTGYTLLPASGPLEVGKGYWLLLSHTGPGGAFIADTSFGP